MELNKIFLSGLTFLWVCSGNGYSADRQDGKFEPKLFQVTTAETRPNDAVLIRGEYLDKIKSVKVLPSIMEMSAMPSLRMFRSL